MSDETNINETLKRKQEELQSAEKLVSTLKQEVEAFKVERQKLTKRVPKMGDVCSIYINGGQRIIVTCANESLVHFARITGHYTTSIMTMKPSTFMVKSSFKFNILEYMEEAEL